MAYAISIIILYACYVCTLYKCWGNCMMTESNRYVNCMIVHNQNYLSNHHHHHHHNHRHRHWNGRCIESWIQYTEYFVNWAFRVLSRKIVKFQLVIKSIYVYRAFKGLYYILYLSSSDDSSEMAILTWCILISWAVYAWVVK